MLIEALTYVKFEFTDCILEVNEKRDTYGDERLAIDLQCTIRVSESKRERKVGTRLPTRR